MVSDSAFPWVASDVQHQLTAAIQRFPAVRELLSIQVRLQSNDPIRWPEARDIAYQVLGSSHPLTRSLERWLRDDQPALRLARHRDASAQGDSPAPNLRSGGSEWGLMFPELHMAPPQPSRDPSLHLRPHLPALMDPPPASPPEQTPAAEEALPTAADRFPAATTDADNVMHLDAEEGWLSPTPIEPLAEPLHPEQAIALVAPFVDAASPATTTQQLPPIDDELVVSLTDVGADRLAPLRLSTEAPQEEALPVFEDLEPLDELSPLDDLPPVEDLVPTPEPEPTTASRFDEVLTPMADALTASANTPRVTDDALQDDDPDASDMVSSLAAEGQEGKAEQAIPDGIVFPALVLPQIDLPASTSLLSAGVAAEESSTEAELVPVREGLTGRSIEPPVEEPMGSPPALSTATIPSGRAASSRLRSLQARLDALKTPS